MKSEDLCGRFGRDPAGDRLVGQGYIRNTRKFTGSCSGLESDFYDAVSKVWRFRTGRAVGFMSDLRRSASFIGLYGPEHEERNDWLRRYPPFICSRLLSGTEGQFSESVFQ